MSLWKKFTDGFKSNSESEQSQALTSPNPIEPTIVHQADSDNSSDGEGNYNNGLNYYKVSGNGFKQDLPKSIQYFSKASDQNHPMANMYLADMYLSGMGCKKDASQGLVYLKKAEALNVEQAFIYLADFYSTRDVVSSIKYFEKYFKTKIFACNVNHGITNRYSGSKTEALKEYFELLVSNYKSISNPIINTFHDVIIGNYISLYDGYCKMESEDEKFYYTDEKLNCKAMIQKLNPNYHFTPNYGKVSQSQRNSDEDFLDGLQLNNQEENSEFEEAEDCYIVGHIHYLGAGDALQDYDEALKYYMHSFELGHTEVCLRLGTMHINGEGCDINNNKALEFFKEGVKRGDDNCYAEMASLFIVSEHYENARKCWDKYFGSAKFNNDADGRAGYACDYLRHAYMHLIPFSHKSRLLAIKPEIKAMLHRISEINCDSDTTAVTEKIYSFLIAE